MGVTGLWKLIEQSGAPVPPETLENKVLAIDISIWLHQAVKGYQDSSGASLPHAHLLSLYGRICKLLHYRIRPVFVFDGGVPYLKRETIRKRAQSKSNNRSEANRLQRLLVESLDREREIQRALTASGAQASADSGSDRAVVQALINRKPANGGRFDRDEMFMLPPLPAEPAAAKLDDSLLNSSADSLGSDDSAVRRGIAIDLSKVDVNGAHFLSLPADIRHELLTDLKATRKQSSWDRLHELPADRDEFSAFQMERLLRRRKVQQGIERAEQEMEGTSMSLAEIERLLCEDGIVEQSAMGAKRVMSDENRRILHVRSVRDAVRKDERLGKQAKEADEADLAVSPPKRPKLEEACANANDVVPIVVEDDDEELQLAIAMSLENPESTVADDGKVDMGNEFAADLQKAIEMSVAERTETIKSNSDVSSIADSDLIEVPDAFVDELDGCVGRSAELTFEMNEEPVPDASMDFRHSDLKLEIVIDTGLEAPKVDYDLFADIFDKESKILVADGQIKDSPKVRESIEIMSSDNSESDNESSFKEIQNPPIVLKESPKDKDLIGMSENRHTIKNENVSVTVDAESSDDPGEIQSDASKDNPIADKQFDEPEANITVESTDETNKKLKQQQLSAFLTITPKKSKPCKDDVEQPRSPETPTSNIKSPFFRKRTPKSGGSSSKHTESNPTKAGPRSAKKSLFAEESATELQQMASSSRQTTNELLLERNKRDRLAVSITDRMSEECQRLLRLFGIPFVVAPMEAEAQCAYLNAVRLTDGTITDDSDIWLFGGRTVYRHFFDQDRRVLEFRADEVRRLFKVERNSLIQLAMLVGSDYTTGVPGIGPVTALEIVSSFPMDQPASDDDAVHNVNEPGLLDAMRRFRQWLGEKSPTLPALRKQLKNVRLAEDFPRAQIVESYARPDVRSSFETFSWRLPDAESLREFAKQTFGWTFERTDETLVPLLRRLQEKRPQQASIRNYFSTQQRIDRREVCVSKRIRRALNQMGAPASVADDEKAADVVEPIAPKSRRKTTNVAQKSAAATDKLATKRNLRAAKPEASTAGPSSGRNRSAPVASVSPAKIELRRTRNARAEIPQRVKADEEQAKRREKAAEIFKQSQAGNSKKTKRK